MTDEAGPGVLLSYFAGLANDGSLAHQDTRVPLEFAELWPNRFDQPSALDLYGPEQEDVFCEAPNQRGWLWNTGYSLGPVVLPDGKPMEVGGPGGLKLNLLSPTKNALFRLRAHWMEFRRPCGPV